MTGLIQKLQLVVRLESMKLMEHTNQFTTVGNPPTFADATTGVAYNANITVGLDGKLVIDAPIADVIFGDLAAGAFLKSASTGQKKVKFINAVEVSGQTILNCEDAVSSEYVEAGAGIILSIPKSRYCYITSIYN